MTTTPQNNDQNLQQAEVTQEDVVIDRSKLISDILDDNSSTERYQLMLEAILEQTNHNVVELKSELTGQLRHTVQESLNLREDEVANFTSPIERKLDILLQNLQSGNSEAFTETLIEIKQAIQDKQTERRLIDIFENDSIQEKRQVMEFLASRENTLEKQAFDRILRKFLPASVIEQYEAIISDQQSSLEERYNLLDDLIKHNSATIPGVDGLGDLIFLVNEVVNSGVQQTGSVQGFLNQLLADGSNLLDSLVDSDIANALTPLRSYNIAAVSLEIPKRQLRSLSQLTVGQVRSIVDNTEMMDLYSQQSPQTYQALMNLKTRFLQSGGPVDEIRIAAADMASDGYGLTNEFITELYSFAANIEDEKIDTIITGYYSEFARNERGTIVLQKGAVLYRWFRKAHAAGNMFMNPFQAFNLRTIRADAQARVVSYRANKTPIQTLQAYNSTLGNIRSGNAGGVAVNRIPNASLEELTRFHSRYTQTIQTMQQDVASIRREFQVDMDRLRSNPPTADLNVIKNKYGLNGVTANQLSTELRTANEAFETRARQMDVDIRTHATQIDTSIEARRQGVSVESGNLDSRMRKGKLANIGKFSLVGGLVIGSGAYGLATGQMNVREAAITVGETAWTMAPTGWIPLFYQALAGETLAGQELSGNDRWMSAAFGVLSLATDFLTVTTGLGIGIRASLMSAATSIKSAPMLTRLGYKVGKLFTKHGKLQTLATSTAKAAEAGNRATRMLNVASKAKPKNLWSNITSIWKPHNGRFYPQNISRLGGVPYTVAATIYRAFHATFSTIGNVISGVKGLTGASLAYASQGYNTLKSRVMLSRLAKAGVDPNAAKTAAGIINKTIKAETQIAKNIQEIARLRSLGGDQSKAIAKLIKANKKIIGRPSNWSSADDGVMQVLDIYRGGSNSPILGALSNGYRGQRLIAKIETGVSAVVLGGAGISMMGGVGNAVVEGDNMITDTVSGTFETAGTLASGASTVASGAVNTAFGLTSYEAVSSNVNRSMERRQREMVVISELKREWRRMSPVDLAYFYMSADFRRLSPRLQREFKEYAKSQGYSHGTLIQIYNTNPR